jgi:uncharacterized membrane protein YhaH (DUF805 family)
MNVIDFHDRRWPLVVATAWASIWLEVAVNYHINQPVGELGITIDGHTYTGNPPALTLYESEGSWVLIMTAIIVGVILVAAIDVTVRRRRKYGGTGYASAIVGVVLLTFSRFGLLWGLASFGVLGLLLIFASRPVKAVVAALG